MILYIIATISTTLLITLVLVLAIVMIASQLWITNTSSDTTIGKYSATDRISNRHLNSVNSVSTQLDTRKMNELIEGVTKYPINQ